MQPIISKLKADYPGLKFKSAKQFSWSPETGEIFYVKGAKGNNSEWSLLHETGHALLSHQSYSADYELIRLEVAAWERARELGGDYGIEIDEGHIQDCLDTYRDWLNKRSICPECSTQCLQQSDFVHYRCHNCHIKWKVSTNRFNRAYRSTKNVQQASSIFT